MNASQLLTGPLAQAIGWALLHLMWQATIVAGILAGALALMSGKNANARYVVSCGALALVFSMFVATAIRAYDPAAAPIVTHGAASASPAAASIPLAQIPVVIAEGAASGLRESAIGVLMRVRNSFPSIVAIWLVGVVLLSSRLMVSWLRARRLVRHGATPASREWQRLGARLSAALGLRRAVTLLESAAIEVPSVIGSLRPIVLLPASALTGLTPEQIEMVLAHELAHIRRHDFFINLLQAVVETLMFYHPAVWWISHSVRVERENCCDDMAVAVCGDPIRYARALTRLEELRGPGLPVVLAANGGSLLDRIRRIAAGRAEGTASTSRWAAAVAMLSILVIAIAIPTLPALAQREEQPKANTSQTTIDVVEPDSTDDHSKVEVDVDVELPDVDIEPPDVDVELPKVDIEPPDVDVDVPDYYVYLDEYAVTPEAPMPPMPPIASMAPMPAMAPMPMLTPPAAVPPVPGIPAVAPVPMATPRPSRAPMAALAPRVPGVGDVEDRELGSTGKLSVDELISLRAAGVTPDYVNAMRELFTSLTLRGVTSMAAVGVTPEFVREMRAAGLDLTTAREAASLRAVGVSAEYIRAMKSAGLPAAELREITSLRAVGVTPEYIAEMRAADFEVKTAREAASLRAVGVTAETVKALRAAGLEVKTARDATSLSAVGVTPEWLRAMREAGVKIQTAREATILKAQNVSPEFVKRLAAAGYANLSTRELARLAAAGVDEEFIRDMEQYRSKK